MLYLLALLALLMVQGLPANVGSQAESAPTDQARVYFNARMALREGRAKEAVKLWLLRNAIESKSGEVSAYDEDFRSVTWAAMGELGLCQDGFPKDDVDAGVGLWPVALHNWVVGNMRRPPPGAGSPPFAAFKVGRQQRFVSIHDVLDAAELRAAHLHRSSCLGPTLLRIGLGERWMARLSDKPVTARVLRHLLRKALTTLATDRVVGRAVIQARIFDLNLQLTELSARAERRTRRRTARAGRQQGLSATAIEEMNALDVGDAISPDSEEGGILADCLSWTVEEWMSLTSERRQFLFAHAARFKADSAAARPLTLAVIDRLIEDRLGTELQSWIAHSSAKGSQGARRALWLGERGRRLLSLDRETGFRERAVIALHRGVDFLARGERAQALGSLAHALRWAETSRAADKVRNLSRRWLSFVASQFRVTDELMVMLRSVVPRADYAFVLEDQLWNAALGADRRSFESCLGHMVGRGALNRRVEMLRPLAQGDAGLFSVNLEERFAQAPYFAIRFIRQFLERLQAQDAGVRAQHVPTLRRLKLRLEQALEQAHGGKRSHRGVEALIGQIRAIIEGLEGLTGGFPSADEGDRAHALSPDGEIFAGSFRVAPSDPLPWPFAVAEVDAPPVFTFISLRPEEWRSQSGALIFGWRVGD